jgi:hypothetical protein
MKLIILNNYASKYGSLLVTIRKTIQKIALLFCFLLTVSIMLSTGCQKNKEGDQMGTGLSIYKKPEFEKKTHVDLQ